MNIFEAVKLWMQVNKLADKLRKELTMKNWVTTLSGVGGAIVLALVTYFQQHGVELKDIVNMIVLAALGFFSKDRNVTGGTIQQ